MKKGMKKFYAFYEMSDTAAEEYIYQLERAELHDNYRCFSIGVRCSLLALGYSEEWVNGKFRELMDEIYSECSGYYIHA